MAVTQSSRKRCHEDVDYVEASKKLRCSPELTSERIRIVVGQTSVTFSLPKARLCSSSEYFKRILNSDWWKEKKPTTFPLSGISQKAFRIYVKWLESGNVDIRSENSNDETDKYTDEELDNVHQCYELAGFLQDDDLKDAMIDVMISTMVTGNLVLTDLPTVIYANSVEISPHRQFVVDCALNMWHPAWFVEMRQENPPRQFLLDLVGAMGSQVRSGTPQNPRQFFKDIDTCKYHEHTKKNAPCYKTKRKISSDVVETPCKPPILSAVFAQN